MPLATAQYWLEQTSIYNKTLQEKINKNGRK